MLLADRTRAFYQEWQADASVPMSASACQTIASTSYNLPTTVWLACNQFCGSMDYEVSLCQLANSSCMYHIRPDHILRHEHARDCKEGSHLLVLSRRGPVLVKFVWHDDVYK